MVKCLALSGSQFTQLLRKVPGISPEPSPSRKTLGPWENKQCLVTAWLPALGESEMSLAVLARFKCWETGLQKHRVRPACLGTTEVWVLRGPHTACCQPLHGSTGASTAQPGPRPEAEVTSKCPVECHSRPALPPPILSRALHANNSRTLNVTHPSKPHTHVPYGQPLGCRHKGSRRRS